MACPRGWARTGCCWRASGPLSVSDFESFHLTIADGAASGAMPALLAWPGADLVYPRDWLSTSVESLVERIATAPLEPGEWHAVAAERFGAGHVLDRLVTLVTGVAL